MKKICLINGSLRGKKAASLAFLNAVSAKLRDTEFTKTHISVKAGVQDLYSDGTIKEIALADAVIFVFPLYAYGLPGALMGLLEDYYRYVTAGNGGGKNAKAYIILNCGFPRPEIVTGEAIRVMRSFCEKVSLDWRFAVCVGTGPIVALTQRVPFLDLGLKKAYKEIVKDISGHTDIDKTDYFIRPIMPEKIIDMIKRRYEKRMRMISANKASLD